MDFRATDMRLAIDWSIKKQSSDSYDERKLACDYLLAMTGFDFVTMTMERCLDGSLSMTDDQKQSVIDMVRSVEKGLRSIVLQRAAAI